MEVNNFINSANIEIVRDAYNQKKISGNFLPTVYVLEPISNCNLSCVMCPNSKLHEDKLGHVNLTDFEIILLKISPYAEHTMLYFMGEPLQYPDFESLIRLARKYLHGKITISTNCMLLSDDVARILLKYKIDMIICCVDHWDKTKYEKIRIGGHFETVVKNIENLLLRRNEEDSETLVVVKSLDFGFKEVEREEFENYWNRRGAKTLIGWIDSWAGQMPDLRKINYQPQPYAKTTRNECADLWFKMIINWKGEVVLCCHNYNYTISFGNIIHKNLEDIWQGDKFIELRNNHVNKIFSCNNLCNKCSEWGKLTEMDVYIELNEENFNLVF